MASRLVGYFLGLLKKFEKKVIENPAKEVLDKDSLNHVSLIEDLLDYPEVLYTKKVKHHKYHTRFDHMMLASKFAYFFAINTGADVRTCVRAAAIHDVWTKGFHVQPAVDFAKKIGEPGSVQEAVATHMVLTGTPKTIEGWVVSWSDECAWGVEMLEYIRLSFRDFLGWLIEISPVNLK